MKLYTLNIRHGGGKRIDRIINSIKKQNADVDVNVITEFRLGENGKYK